MLEPLPPLTPTVVSFVLNSSPFYTTVKVSDPASVTVNAILQHAYNFLRMYTGTGVVASELRLRWITDQSMAFSSPHQPKRAHLDLKEFVFVKNWYMTKGKHLASSPIDSDATLQEKLRDIAKDPLLVQLYVVAPPVRSSGSNVEEERTTYILHYGWGYTGSAWGAKKREELPEESILTRMAPLYEPAFAQAENALRNYQEARLDERCHDGAADSDEISDAHLFVPRLRDALDDLKAAGHSQGDTPLASALGKLFQDLFDDPTLKVNVKSSGIDGDPRIELDIKGRCPTAYGIPALYVVGKDRLMSASTTEGVATEAQALQGMLAYRSTVVARNYTAISGSTCCPCLVIGIKGTTVQLHAAYFTDRIYRTHICEFTLDGSLGLPSDDDALKFQVIRSTARMLRTSYAMVHIGAPLEYAHRARLLPNPSIVMPAPLPLRLRILDRVGANLGAYGDLFTGELGPELSTDDDDDDDETQAGPKPVAVHVKFVDAYGVDAHRLLAEHKGADGEPRPLAPTLYWAGTVTPGGLMMIVMESLPKDAHTLFWHQPRPEPQPDPKDPEFRYRKRRPGPDPVSWDELGDLRAAVELLHGHGFVHGDIRPQNVLLQRRPRRASDDGAGSGNGGTGAPRAYLVDFDVAGKEGEARYPADLNPGVRWPRPASELNGQLIKKDHDVFMLKRLLKVPKRKHAKERGHQEDGGVDNRKSKRRRVS